MNRIHESHKVRLTKILSGAAAFGAGCLLCLSAAAAGKTAGPAAGPVVLNAEELTTSREIPAQSADPQAPFLRESESKSSSLHLLMNKSTVLETKTAYKRVSVGQPDIADVNLLGPGRLLVTGKKAGSTQVIVWDDNEKAEVLDVSVQVDVKGLSDQLGKMFPGQKIEVSANNGELVLRGTVPSLEMTEQIAEVAKSYASLVHNFLVISGGQQVLLTVKFAEVSRSATDALGINTGFTDGKSFFGNNVGGVNPFGTKDAAGGGQQITSPSPAAAVTLFGQGLIGKAAFQYFIQALRNNNLLRILAEPQLQAISGQEASFLAGGTIPIPVSQGGTSGSAVSVVEREYGVKLKFVPVVLGDGRIRLKVSPEVSDLDYANGVQMNGFVIPGLTQRKVTTTVELADGQSFAIAGLLNTSIASNKSVTPFLGDLPIIGPVFRTVSYSKKETEMVVLVTAHLVEPMNPADVPMMPGEMWREPTENDLFFNQDLGGPAGSHKSGDLIKHDGLAKHTPKFQGQYGFNAVGPVTPEVTPVPSSLAHTGND